MRINNVVGFSNAITGRNIAFERKLRENEKKDYTDSINKALDYLGVQNRALIIHGPSFPARAGENSELAMGSPYNNEEFIDFLKLHGFNGIQLGPTGKLNRGDTSPYSSSVFAKNPLFIDFSLLEDKRYASILSKEEIEESTDAIEETDKNYTRADYKEAEEINRHLTGVAYQNYLERLSNNDEDALRLQEEFDEFKKENSYWLEYYSVLNTIAEKYGTDYYPNWSKEDSTLIQRYKKGDESAIQYYNSIKDEHGYDIDKYQFIQFIADKQAREDKKQRGDFVYISDLLVSVSSYDEMIFQDIFDKEWKIGAHGGGIMNSPQLWNFPLVDPNKLFNKDGSLGPSGQFVQMKIRKAVQDASNIRIDHAFGLVDPFVYKPNTVHNITVNHNGQSVSIPDKQRLKSGYLSQTGVDRNKNFQKIIPNIIVPTLREAGIDPKKVVWEDLGHDPTGLYGKVCRQGLKLPGIDVLIWRRGETANKDNWAYLGCHDNAPLREAIETREPFARNPQAWDNDYLSGYLNPGSRNGYKRSEFKRRIQSSNKDLFMAKLTELFRSTKNIQISFMDFFGINKRFNTPGTTGNDNWNLRLTPDWEDKYYKSLEGDNKNDNWAINMPQVLARAVEAKADMEIAKREDSITPRETYQIRQDANKIIGPLNKYSEILKEETD